MPNFKLSSVTKPFTPAVRRLLHDVFKPSIALGKRLRDVVVDEDQENMTPLSVSGQDERQRNRIALQSEDAEEDAVVITALNAVPFCCHADLLLMNREQLVEVAQSLNNKLPLKMRIDLARSDAFIRNSVEVVVGIRHVVPEAPKANRSLSLSLSNLNFKQDALLDTVVPLTPASPLALRNRSSNSMGEYLANPPLVSLREESEEPIGEADRPPKRRRMEDTSPDVSPTPVRRKIMSRSQSDRVAPGHSQSSFSARDRRILRSRSERLPLTKLLDIHRNITITRGRKRNRLQSAVVTSTPKPHKSTTTDEFAPAESRESMSMNSLCTTSSSSDSLSSTPRLERVGIWLTRTSALDNDTREVTSGIEDMSMNPHPQISSSSAMDVSM